MGGGAVRNMTFGTQAWLDAGCPSPVAVNARDGSVLVYVPGGAFEMGSGQGEGGEAERPKHRVDLSAYWIGVYAVTNAQYLKFVEATGHRAPDKTDYSGVPAVWRGKSFPGEKGEHPVVCVSWEDAGAYAKWAGCGLASEAQWEKACRGPLGLAYPWGEEWDAKKCRHDKNKGHETTCAVYGYPAGVSGYGTYNQSGNVWEWCEDWYGEDYYKQPPGTDPRGPDRGSSRVLRGGCWWYVDPAIFRAAYRGRVVPGYRDGIRGLRLVRIAS